MSWDIFVFKLPPGVTEFADIPDDFDPPPIGKREEIIAAIQELYPEADFSDPSCGHLISDAARMEISMGNELECTSFAFHVRGGDSVAEVVAAILYRLNLSAIDPQSDTGIFDVDSARETFRRWQGYRDQVLGNGGPSSELDDESEGDDFHHASDQRRGWLARLFGRLFRYRY